MAALGDRLVQVADVMPVGNPFTTDVALGPIVDEAQLQRVDGIVRDSVSAGAHLKAGGTYEGIFTGRRVDSVTLECALSTRRIRTGGICHDIP